MLMYQYAMFQSSVQTAFTGAHSRVQKKEKKKKGPLTTNAHELPYSGIMKTKITGEDGKQYGFIECPETWEIFKRDIYFDGNSLQGMKRDFSSLFKSLRKNARVRFSVQLFGQQKNP